MENAINIIIGTTAIILIILLIRSLLWKKCNPNILYFLWIFVAIRILFPFNFIYTLQSDYFQDIFPEVRSTTSAYPGDDSGYMPDDAETNLNVSPVYQSAADTDFFSENNTGMPQIPTQNKPLGASSDKVQISAEQILLAVWLSGCILLAVYIIVVNIKFMYGIKKKQIGLLSKKIPVYEVEGHNCLVGIFKPCIFISPQIRQNDDHKRFVFMHEMEHYRMKDNFWLFVKTVCLILQWFNPLVWIAYHKSTEDCELACDYRVLSGLSDHDRDSYADSLLYILKCNQKSSHFVSAMAKGNTGMKKRLVSIYKERSSKKYIWLLGVLLLITMLAFIRMTVKGASINSVSEHTQSENLSEIHEPNGSDTNNNEVLVENLSDIERGLGAQCTERYITDIVRGGNHYWIDEQGTLWGTGSSEYGQLGLLDETLSKVFDPIAIAENVIHVDFSGEYFLIYLTSDHCLYGLGGNAAGILDSSSMDDRNSMYMNVQITPVLLMQNVLYAQCGYSTIIALQENGDVYVMGNNNYAPFFSEDYVAPQKVMENAKYVTSYFHSYAVIDDDNSLWTWGDNKLGQCGVGTFSSEITEPQKILDDVACAWMGKAAFNSSGEVTAHDCLIALKTDGSALGCGEGIGKDVHLSGGINDFDELHPQQVITSADLVSIRFREFVPFSLLGAELNWSEEELVQFLVEKGVDYYTSYTYEENYLLYSANNGEWNFIFCPSGQLAVITSYKNDEIEKNMLKSGDSLEKAVECYGSSYVVRDQIYDYSELVYDMDGYVFIIGGYSDLGCAKFSIEISGFLDPDV